MLSVPRETFVPDDKREAAYVGENLTLAPGRVVLEARTLAKLLDALDIQPTELVLDVGCGLGYSAAVIARLAETVVALEEDEALAADAQRLLSEEGVDNAVTVTGKLTEGSATCAPYDVITIEGGVEEIPAAILAQLKDGGRIGAIFMDSAVGTARIGYRCSTPRPRCFPDLPSRVALCFRPDMAGPVWAIGPCGTTRNCPSDAGRGPG